MRDRKKAETDEMLVVHQAAKAADPDKAGRNKGGGGGAKPRAVPALDKEELALLKKRFFAARDDADKRGILAEVQQRFGNEKAAALVKEARKKGEDPPVKAPPKPPGKNKP